MGPIARILGVSLTILSLASPSLARPHRWRNLALAGTLAPDPSNPGTLYICSSTTVFRSTDAGVNWTITGILAGGARALAVDPSSGVTLYAGNDEGLYKSTDAGFSWSLANAGGTATPDGFDLVAALPGNPVHIFAAAYALSTGTSDGVYESTDGGGTWSLLDVPGGVITQISADPARPGGLYAAAESSGAAGGGLFRSLDGGVSWIALLGGPPQGPVGVSALDFDPFDGNVLYAATDGGLLASRDGGDTWAAIAGGLPAGGVVSVLAHPANSLWLYAGSAAGGTYRTFDGGATWYPMVAGWPEGFAGYELFLSGGNLFSSTAVGEFAWDLTADTCAPDARTLCLDDDRFIVQATWRDFQNHTGPASVVPGAASDTSGVLWFFSPDNWELLVKVLDGCGVNGHYWVLGAAATNVQYVVQVTDTQTGEVKNYLNPLGTVSPAITDTSAFAECP